MVGRACVCEYVGPFTSSRTWYQSTPMHAASWLHMSLQPDMLTGTQQLLLV